MFKVNELLKATGGRLIQGKQDTTISGISINSRQIAVQEAFIAIKGNNFDGHDFIDEAIRKGAGCIIHRPKTIGHRPKATVFIEVKDTTKALGDIARFHRARFDIPVIAVTGSNGKTTTKEMIAGVLSGSYKVLKNEGTKNNQIGLPLTLLDLNSSHDIVVLEIGTNHFGEIGYLAGICKPNIGIIISIGPAHLEYLRNLKGVFKEKYTLIEKLQKPYLAILNRDDSLLRKEIARNIRRPFILGFGIKKRSDFFASDIKAIDGGLEFLFNLKYKFTLETLGYYNIYNALAAIAVGYIFGVGHKKIVSILSSFDFPKGRLNPVKLNNVRFLDDTYNSNPASLKQALAALANFNTKGRRIFVMGDMLELGSRKEAFHYQAGQKAAQICDALITVGELSKLSAKAAKNSKLGSKNIFTCETSGEARNILFNKISPKEDDIVLVKGSRLMKMEEVFKK